MIKKRHLIYAFIIIFTIAILGIGSYSFWSWTSGTNKNIIFNTASNLKEYINYDAGESKFVGDFQIGDDYPDGIHSTISLSKTSEVANLSLLATIHMDIKEIGNNMKVSPALKWTVTKGTSTNVIEELATGNFIGTNAGDTLTLVPSINVTTEKTDYTIWIWLDEAENPSDLLTGEKLSTNVWTEINQLDDAEDRFEITLINANYQTISATVVDNKYKVTHYAITTSDSTPSSWTEITPASDKNNVYNLTDTDNTRTVNTTYYVWFKDENNRTAHKSVKVTAVDTTPPSCTWGSWSVSTIGNNDTSSITLTCTDNESEITISNLTTSSITKSNNNINITNVVKASVTNGYAYTITVTGTETDGETTLTLPADTIKNAIYPKVTGNTAVTSDPITVGTGYTVKFATENNNCQLDNTYSDKTPKYGTAFNTANPSCTGYTFTGWTASNTLDTSNAKYGTSQSAVNTTWSNGSTPVTATWFNNLANKTDKTITLTATWTLNTYTITYTLDGGSQTSPKTSYTVEDANFTLVNPTKSGYDFAGWTGSNGTTPQTTVTINKGSTGNKTYTANWTPKTYEVTLNKNGGSGGTSTLYGRYTDGVYLDSARTSQNMTTSNNPITIPTKTGYTFMGYYNGASSQEVPVSFGDYVSYTPPTTSYPTDTSYTGYELSQTINPSELNKWRVIAINNDGSVDIMSEYVSSVDVYFQGSVGYQNLAGYLNILARAYEDDGTLTKVGAGRHFGYAPSTIEFCSGTVESCPHDTGYESDYNLIHTSTFNNALLAFYIVVETLLPMNIMPFVQSSL